MVKVERTLMKSPPELWGMVDDEARMRRWSEHLAGAPGEIQVVEREPERRLSWRPASSGGCGQIRLSLEKNGWGTRLEIAIEPCDGGDERVKTLLDRVFDDFNSAHKRPFTKV
jgi:hypothetical protein